MQRNCIFPGRYAPLTYYDWLEDQGRIQEIRKGGGTGRGWVREGEALSNITILTHIHNEKLALIT